MVKDQRPVFFIMQVSFYSEHHSFMTSAAGLP